MTLALVERREQDLAGLVTISTPVIATPLIGLLQDPTVPDRFVRPDMGEVLCSDPRVGTFQYPQQSKKERVQVACLSFIERVLGEQKPM